MLLAVLASGCVEYGPLPVHHSPCLDSSRDPTILGTVEDRGGAPLASVQVSMWTYNEDGVRTGNYITSTRGDGTFHFCELTPHSYSLTFRKDGFQERIVQVERTSSTLHHRITLDRT